MANTAACTAAIADATGRMASLGADALNNLPPAFNTRPSLSMLITHSAFSISIPFARWR
ncbi:MAG: hypothetical protein HYZ37_09300 [Candidatus Solibacter usitatus]|nr:hypothetical protein [Candidatus Solibacter usitatus]